ncbi:UNVERIFIED_CONTAM: hypothetical protein GTU68_065310 [Idotea baltica]|nr:hypothetical protein [Idotea baltica]
MFLYLKNKDDFSTLPEKLFKLLGETTFTFDFDLTEDKKLVRADAKEVMKALDNTGYFLQMPPAKSELLGMNVD